MVTVNEAIIKIRKIISERSPSIWLDDDLVTWYTDAIRRIKTGSEFLSGLTVPLVRSESTNIHDDFNELPNIFVAARCFETDKQYYEAAQKMNEFETKRLEYIDWVEENPKERAILATGTTLDDAMYQEEYVVDKYSDGTVNIIELSDADFDSEQP